MKKVVGINYDRQKDKAPKIVAKGKGIVADKILEIAETEGITIYEDAELVNQLLQFDFGENIPEVLYEAVAGILAYVYSMDEPRSK